MSKLGLILNGWKNVVWENPRIEKLAESRAKICAECHINVDGYCNTQLGGCGCPLIAKLRSEFDKCPQGKW